MAIEPRALDDTYHVVNILPVVQCDQLKSSQHGPEKIVKAGEPIVGILSNTVEAHKTMGARPEF